MYCLLLILVVYIIMRKSRKCSCYSLVCRCPTHKKAAEDTEDAEGFEGYVDSHQYRAQDGFSGYTSNGMNANESLNDMDNKFHVNTSMNSHEGVQNIPGLYLRNTEAYVGAENVLNDELITVSRSNQNIRYDASKPTSVMQLETYNDE